MTQYERKRGRQVMAMFERPGARWERTHQAPEPSLSYSIIYQASGIRQKKTHQGERAPAGTERQPAAAQWRSLLLREIPTFVYQMSLISRRRPPGRS